MAKMVSTEVKLDALALETLGINTFQGYNEKEGEVRTLYLVQTTYYINYLRKRHVKYKVFQYDEREWTIDPVFTLCIPYNEHEQLLPLEEREKAIADAIDEFEKYNNWGCSHCGNPLPEDKLVFVHEIPWDSDQEQDRLCPNCLPHN